MFFFSAFTAIPPSLLSSMEALSSSVSISKLTETYSVLRTPSLIRTANNRTGPLKFTEHSQFTCLRASALAHEVPSEGEDGKPVNNGFSLVPEGSIPEVLFLYFPDNSACMHLFACRRLLMMFLNIIFYCY